MLTSDCNLLCLCLFELCKNQSSSVEVYKIRNVKQEEGCLSHRDQHHQTKRGGDKKNIHTRLGRQKEKWTNKVNEKTEKITYKRKKKWVVAKPRMNKWTNEKWGNSNRGVRRWGKKNIFSSTVVVVVVVWLWGRKKRQIFFA